MSKNNKNTIKKKENKSLTVVEVPLAESLIGQAINKKVSVETIERLLAMRRELKQEKATEAYNFAMSRFQAECPIIKKAKKVLNKDKTLRYSYAPIDSIVRQVKNLIQKYGFSYTIDAIVDEKWVTAICKVIHDLGHSETSQFKIPIDSEAYMNQSQKFASALTFAKRYAFCNAFGILTGDEDDDSINTKTKEKKDDKKDDKKIYQLAIEAVEKEEDVIVLNELIPKIQESKLYNQAQKDKLIKTINDKIKKATG